MKKLATAIILFCLCFLLPRAVYADFYFCEDFNASRPINTLDTDKWNFFVNNSCGTRANIKEADGYLWLSQCASASRFPFVVSKVNPFPESDYSVQINFQYTKVTFWGTGIGMSDVAPENGVDQNNLFSIKVWQDLSNYKFRLSHEDDIVYQSDITQTPHTFRVDKIGNKYYLYLDNTLLFTSQDENTNIKYIWMGNPGKFSPVIPSWTEFKVDYIRVSPLYKRPLIFIPGIGGSELVAEQDIIWPQKAYGAGEKIWVNESEAKKLGSDDYFDVLKLSNDGLTSLAPLKPNGYLVPYGYSDIPSFFESIGYKQNTDFFIFAYDWRKDVGENNQNLKQLVDQAKLKTNSSQVDIVSHSMGGLVATNYATDNPSDVYRLIKLGVPHLGSVNALKTILYGSPLGQNVLGFFPIGISQSEIKDISQNSPSLYQLLPTANYYKQNDLAPFLDVRDVDADLQTGALGYAQTKQLFANLGANASLFSFSENLHNKISTHYSLIPNIKIYNIAGTGQPTIAQIKEGWWIDWPIKLLPRYEQIYTNGDGTVPLSSAAIGETYYTEQNHQDLVKSSGQAMQIVRSILLEDQITQMKSDQIRLEGSQVSIQNAEVEVDDPDIFVEDLANSKQIFIKKTSKPVKIKVTPAKVNPTTHTYISAVTYKNDRPSQFITYDNIKLEQNKVEVNLTPEGIVEVLVNNLQQTPSYIGETPDPTIPQPIVESISVSSSQTTNTTSDHSVIPAKAGIQLKETAWIPPTTTRRDQVRPAKLSADDNKSEILGEIKNPKLKITDVVIISLVLASGMSVTLAITAIPKTR